jgi:hypothetical protein
MVLSMVGGGEKQVGNEKDKWGLGDAVYLLELGLFLLLLG